MANEKFPQASQLETLEPQGKIPPFFKRNFLIIAMFVLGVILLFPLAFFISSQLSSRNPQAQNVIKKETFAPQAPYVADQLIVKLKEFYTRDELERLKNKLDELGVVSQEKAFKSDHPSLKNYYILKFKKGTDMNKVGQELKNLPELEEVEPNYIITTQASPSDLYYPQQWDLERIKMPEAWDLVKGSNAVKIAVIDTGIDYNHQDFSGRNIIKGLDFATCDGFDEQKLNCISPKQRDNDPMDDNGHGTHVAGTIGAVTDNSLGVAGINWDVTLMAVKVMGKLGQGDLRDIIDGITYAADSGAKVINISLGSPVSCPNSYQNAINYAVNRGIIIVAAAGNDNKDAQYSSPSSCSGVIAVGNSDRDDARWGSSNFGDTVDIAAPGTEIYSTMPGNAYESKAGTSMAAPHVAGVVGLLLALNPNLSLDQARTCLVNNADQITTDKYIGPRLNAYRAVSNCNQVLPPTATPSPSPSPSPTPTPTPTVTPTITPPIIGTATPTSKLTPTNTVAPIANVPVVTKKTTPTLTPYRRYTCREAVSPRTALPGSIKIGSLVCEPI